MKRIIFLSFILFITSALYADKNPDLKNVFVEEVFLGEFDSEHVGDAFILFVRTADEELYGLVNHGWGSGDEQEMRNLQGTFVSIPQKNLNGVPNLFEMKNQDEISALKSYRKDAHYHYWNGHYSAVVVDVRDIETRETTSLLKNIKQSGDYIIENGLGGNSGFVNSFKFFRSQLTDITAAEVLRRYLYLDDPNYIRTVHFDNPIIHSFELQNGVAHLLGQDSYEDVLKFLNRHQLDVSRIDILASPELLDDVNLEILTGEISFYSADDAVLNFIAFYDYSSDKGVVIVQGNTE